MKIDFSLLHTQSASQRRKSDPKLVESPVLVPSSGEAVSWKTCLREMLLGHGLTLAPKELSFEQSYHGHQAYQFLLEIVCGLHSPIKGETEVHGQYWKLIEAAKPDISKEFYKLLHQVHVHAKRVRTEHLVGLGSQSYGSYVRKKMKKLDEVNLVGSGQLCIEILPWLMKSGARLRVHARNPHLKLDLQKQFPKIILEDLNSKRDVPLTGGLIVAAPLESDHIREFISDDEPRLKTILDLRGESKEDPIATSAHLQTLNCVFSEVEKSKENIQEKIKSAREMIGELVLSNRVSA